MGIDASIYAQIQQPKIESPLNALAQVSQVRNAMSQNRLVDLKFTEAEREATEAGAMNKLFSGAVNPDGTIDRPKVLSGAAQGGLGAKIPSLLKGFTEQDVSAMNLRKTQGEVNTGDFKLNQDKHKVALQHMYSMLADPGLSYEKVAGGIQQGIQEGRVDAKIGAAQLQTLPQDPEALRAHLQRGLLSLLTPEKQIEASQKKVEFKDTGGEMTGIQMNPNLPGYGQPVQGAQIPKTRSPDSFATVAQSKANSELTDARAREFNGTKVEENRIKREAKDDATALTKAGQVASFDTMLGTLDRLGKHPGLASSVGLSGAFPTMPGSESANFQAELNTFKSQAFIPMVSQLKGMGALSDAEGKYLTSSVGALDPKMGETAFRASVNLIISGMNAARERLVGGGKAVAPVDRSGPKPTAPQSLRKSVGGRTYENDGKGWYEVK